MCDGQSVSGIDVRVSAIAIIGCNEVATDGRVVIGCEGISCGGCCIIDSGDSHGDGSGVTDSRMRIGGGIGESDLACFSGGEILEGGAGIEGKGAIAIGVGSPFRRRHYDVVSQCAGIVVSVDIRGQDAGGDGESIFRGGDVGV
ncbi:hypothetical protein V144x_31510 [Gimesia aquarii]|uniref:Uncharacterized protein n=1 Tax=Gimesia aquarii TaxID=2527964 RepID=A0A517VXE3_9PLAN|nr:hypothetical protein V144x_31510 [Gimesia aquarii]